MFSSFTKLFKNPGFYFVVILSLAYFLIGFYNLNNVGLAGDETAHLGAAQSYTTGHGVNVEHPTLLKNLNAGVIAIFFPEFQSKDNDQWGLGVNFLLQSQHTSSQILLYSRLVYLFFNSLFILALWFYTFKLKFLTPSFSWLFGIFWVFSPSIFSHNFLITFDVAGSWTSFIVMVSTLYFSQKFTQLKVQNIVKSAILPASFLALALNTKFSNFLWVFILSGFYGLFYYVFRTTKDKTAILKLRKTLLIFLSVNLSFIWLNNFIAFRDRFLNLPFAPGLSLLEPFYVYLKGFVMTIGRSDHTQPNFMDDKFNVINYHEFINRVFWFKENPMLIILILILALVLGYLVLKNRHYLLDIKKNQWLILLKKYWFIVLIISFPGLYLAASFNSKLTIGYRHFYPVLIFIYAFLALIISSLNFKYKQFVISFIIIIYAVFGVLGINSNVSYTNFFWQKPKWQLIRDSTIYWGESETKGFKFLKDNNLFKSSSDNLLTGEGWNLALANGAGPNTNIALQEIIGKGKLLDNFWAPFVDINKTQFVDLKQDYLVVDINTIQELSDKSGDNPISKINLEFLLKTKPIYDDKQVFFIYKLY